MREVTADTRDFRMRTAQREIPRTLTLTGSVFSAMVLANWITGLSSSTDRAIECIVIGCMALALWVAKSGRFAPTIAPWTFAVASSAAATAMLVELHLRPSGPGFAYLVLVLVAIAPLTLAWAPALTALIPLFLACVEITHIWNPVDRASWVLVTIAAIALSFVLLAVRLGGIDDLAASTALVQAMAVRDRLTGLLNRHGLEEHAADLLPIARRQGADVFVVFLDVDGLKHANDRFGHAVGDQILRASSAAINAATRESDLLGRWGGDEFVIVGMGAAPDPDVVSARIQQALLTQPVSAEHWSGGVSVGCAGMHGAVAEFDELVRLADLDMYRRRQAARSRS